MNLAMYINSKRLKYLINEELTKTEVKDIIDDQLDAFIKKREFEKKIRKIVADAFDDFVREIWSRKSFWKGPIENG